MYNNTFQNISWKLKHFTIKIELLFCKMFILLFQGSLSKNKMIRFVSRQVCMSYPLYGEPPLYIN